MPRKTYHDGANELRSSMLKQLRLDFDTTDSLRSKKYIKTLITWVRGHNERTDARTGGLGKK